MGVHGCSWVLMGAHRCSCVFVWICFCSHPFFWDKKNQEEVPEWLFNLGFDCFLIFSAINWRRTPSDWQTLGLKGILWNHFNEHSNKLTNWKMSQLDGLSLVVVGKKNRTSAWWELVVFNVSFLGKVGKSRTQKWWFCLMRRLWNAATVP